jgi:hypothetical protein
VDAGRVQSGELFTRAEAKRMASRLLDLSALRFSGHALAEMAKDRLIEADALNTIRHGTVHRATLQTDGTYSYKLTRRDIAIAVSFRFDGSTAVAIVVRTAWRIRRKR